MGSIKRYFGGIWRRLIGIFHIAQIHQGFTRAGYSVRMARSVEDGSYLVIIANGDSGAVEFTPPGFVAEAVQALGGQGSHVRLRRFRIA